MKSAVAAAAAQLAAGKRKAETNGGVQKKQKQVLQRPGQRGLNSQVGLKWDMVGYNQHQGAPSPLPVNPNPTAYTHTLTVTCACCYDVTN